MRADRVGAEWQQLACRRYLLVAVILGLLAGCATDHSSRYSISQDRAPEGDYDVSGLVDAVPRYEPPRTAGNKTPYTVWGKQYRVMDSAEGYVERGTASWYGQKFHGHKTSNGETFDMYAMSAAHKSLPIPGYARVTNLDNGRSVIVRVNDRGPFHGNRLIDLSYAAAKKLGYQSRGTARVEVAAITVRPDGSTTVAGQAGVPVASPAPAAEAEGNTALFVQLGSFSVQDSAHGLSRAVRQHTLSPVRVRRVETDSGLFHRVQVGPFVSEEDAAQEQNELRERGFGQSKVLTDITE